MTTLDFVLACLATWRVSSLLVREEGPYALLARVRRALRATLVGRALDCFYCTSLWVAAPVALWLVGPTRPWAIVWLALSGAAILAERLTTPRQEPEIEALELDEAVAAMQNGTQAPEAPQAPQATQAPQAPYTPLSAGIRSS